MDLEEQKIKNKRQIFCKVCGNKRMVVIRPNKEYKSFLKATISKIMDMIIGIDETLKAKITEQDNKTPALINGEYKNFLVEELEVMKLRLNRARRFCEELYKQITGDETISENNSLVKQEYDKYKVKQKEEDKGVMKENGRKNGRNETEKPSDKEV